MVDSEENQSIAGLQTADEMAALLAESGQYGDDGDGEGSPTLGNGNGRVGAANRVPRSSTIFTANGSPTGGIQRMQSTGSLNGDSKAVGIFCKVDEDDHTVARIVVHPVANFSDSLPEFRDKHALRSTCIIFLLDVRGDVMSQASDLLGRWTELRYNISPLLKKNVCLSFAFFQHCDEDSFPASKGPDDAIASLVVDVRNFVKGRGLDNDFYSVDFDDDSSLYQAAAAICENMHRQPNDDGSSSNGMGRTQRRSCCCTVA